MTVLRNPVPVRQPPEAVGEADHWTVARFIVELLFEVLRLAVHLTEFMEWTGGKGDQGHSPTSSVMDRMNALTSEGVIVLASTLGLLSRAASTSWQTRSADHVPPEGWGRFSYWFIGVCYPSMSTKTPPGTPILDGFRDRREHPPVQLWPSERLPRMMVSYRASHQPSPLSTCLE